MNFILYTNKAKLLVLTGNALLIATRKKIQVQLLDIFHRNNIYAGSNRTKEIWSAQNISYHPSGSEKTIF